MNTGRNAIAVAGIRGGSGKTLVSIGIIKALRMSGLSVAPFKKGPDYIDPAWLGLASGRQCHNLDTFLMTGKDIIETFLNRNADADIAVIEGNRGIYDGFDAEGTHSFAELIKLIGAPVILVVDCTKCSRTTAALVRGCMEFDRMIEFSGVILNQIAGERHRKIVTESIERYCGITVLGAIPRINTPSFTERHLGLVPIHEQKEPVQIIDEIARTVLEKIDLKKIIDSAGKGTQVERKGTVSERSDYSSRRNMTYPLETDTSEKNNYRDDRRPVIGVLRDSAFNFYYPENLELLKIEGARLVFVNSLEESLPSVDGLYIGGGFPETHAAQLTENSTLRRQIRELVEEGKPVYAECGGLIYLSSAVISDTIRYPMVGIYPFEFTLSPKPEGHGYTIFEVDSENPFYQKGSVVRGHEFRYSRLVDEMNVENQQMVFNVLRGKGFGWGRDGLLYKNTLATFCHTHGFGENVQWISSLVRIAGSINNG